MNLIRWLAGEDYEEQNKKTISPSTKDKRWERIKDLNLIQITNEIENEKESTNYLQNIFPSNFKEYIGQERIKSSLSKYIQGIKKREKIFPHTIISGQAGGGKTSLARIIAKELNRPYRETIASSVEDIKTLLPISRGEIIFVDEIHGLSREQVEQMYQVMENFTREGEPIPEFTLIGATTELGEIIKDRLPFFERFKISLTLEDYNYDEIKRIIKNYKTKFFEKETIPRGSIPCIAKNCRINPRTAKKLFDSLIYLEGNIKEVLDSFGIIENGFTKTDLKVLKYLTSNPVVGLQSICSYLGTSEENYLYDVEPYLLRTGTIVRLPRGRKLTLEGIKIMRKLARKLNV